MFNPEEQDTIREVKITTDAEDKMFLIGSERFEKFKQIQIKFDEAAATLDATIQALKAMGMLKKVDYKMLQLTNYSIRTYYDKNIKTYEGSDLELSTPLILNKDVSIDENKNYEELELNAENNIDEAFIHCFKILADCFAENGELYEEVGDFFDEVGENTFRLVTGIAATLAKGYRTSSPNLDKKQNEVFCRILKNFAKNIYKVANSTKDLNKEFKKVKLKMSEYNEN